MEAVSVEGVQKESLTPISSHRENGERGLGQDPPPHILTPHGPRPRVPLPADHASPRVRTLGPRAGPGLQLAPQVQPSIGLSD